MKNKEIESILNELKINVNKHFENPLKYTKEYKDYVLLSYIEQLEKENENLKQKHYLIEGGRGNLKSYTLKLEKENKQLKNNRDKAIEILSGSYCTYDDVIKILKR